MTATSDVPVGVRPGGALADLPVEVDVAGDVRPELVSWLEGDLGWQVVAGGGALSAQVVITDDAARATGAVLIVDSDMPAQRKAMLLSTALRSGAVDVVEWPDERERLVTAVTRPDAVRGHAAGTGHDRWGSSAPRVLRVAGVCGGAGTSTVALALAGCAAWAGARAVVAGGDDLLALCGLAPWAGPGTVEIATLPPHDAGREIGALSRPVPGVAGLRAIGGGGPVPAAATSEWPVDVVVLDNRSRVEAADVVVGVVGPPLRRSAQHRERILVRCSPVVGRRELAALLGGPPAGWIDDDPRVLRAGLAGRVPSALPGRWLRRLADGVAQRRGGGVR